MTTVEEIIQEAINQESMVLSLYNSKIQTFPIEIFQLTNLRYLDISNNDIKVLPPEICDFKKLDYLDIYGNKIEVLPPEIGNLTNLEYFIVFICCYINNIHNKLLIKWGWIT